MTALVILGARLARAGGRLRLWSVIGGCAIAVAILATAWALPDALYPVTGPMTVDARRAPLVTLLEGLTVPVLALVLTVARLSSQVRDRRLASLRLLGVSRTHAGVVGAVENLVPALAGAGLGVGGYLALRAAMAQLIGDQLHAPIALPLPQLALVATAVVAFSVALALAPLRRIGRPRDGHADSVIRQPSLWRLAPLAASVAAFVGLLSLPAGGYGALVTPLFLTGILSGALGIALAAPVVTFVAASGLVRSGRVTGVLAGRGIQTQSAPIGRRVVALGLAVYIVVGGAGLLGVYENTLYLKAAIHQIEVGPQEIGISTSGPLTGTLAADLGRVAGVRAVVPGYPIDDSRCSVGTVDGGCASVFVGTCDGLSALMVVTGCRDDQPAWIAADLRAYKDNVTAVDSINVTVDDGRDRPTHTVELAATFTQNVPATTREWVWPGRADVFIPASLAESWGVAPTGAAVIADAGAQIRVQVEQVAQRHSAQSFSLELRDYDQVVSIRTAAWTVMSLAIGVALLTYALSTIDRALETRRARARLVSLGVPARLLRRVGSVQNAIPLVSNIVLAAGLGLVTTLALSHNADQPFAIAPGVAVTLFGGVVLGAALVSAATMPLTRGRTRASDLREE
ncbi:FtsX-like permease family protein [Cellulomonas sp. P24]|uniref:FtsX-like permease family protein n=1 Tax=Cellulomonas sp. P24 TaxID=2885206 RepID=UPI00216B0882|nr:FtsX-like permease family protein [Cellulomonas sp. P24]MCR6494768.1 hypothetical protein [Cellulomonas sp. P24]